MRVYIVAFCLIASLMLAGCSRSSDAKSQPPIPVASGDIIRAVFQERIVPANGIFTNYVEHTAKAHILNEGHIAVYESGIVTISEPDGTKYALVLNQLNELSFK